MRLLRMLIGCLLIQASAQAAEIPAPSDLDERVRYVTYQQDEVTTITVRRGVVTRIVLADDERISIAASGFLSDCKAEAEWCIRADVGTNQIWVKPKEHATHNNLELRTDKRDYSFEFNVLPDNALGRWRKPQNGQGLEAEAMYRVIFRYPLSFPSIRAVLPFPTALDTPARAQTEEQLLAERLEDAAPQPINWAYSMEILQGAQDIVPALVFDDGRFTYFSFPPNRDIPAVFYLSPSGEETRVNVHMEKDLAVVQRLGRRFVLRLGHAVVGIWNDAYDTTGRPSTNGVTIKGVSRVLR